MLPIGQLSLYFSAAIALILCILPMIGVAQKNERLIQLASPLTLWLFSLLLISMLSLGAAFWLNDFTYTYVSQYSNTRLPLYYRLTAIWGGHEGSMLLWVFILSGWMAGVVLFSKSLPSNLRASILSILAAIALGFICFLIFTSDPFGRQLPFFPLDGKDLNPLLQDIGLIIHPPLLYMGYVGAAIPFAFVCASLLLGHFDRSSIRWVRPWALMAWLFLTLGITVGSWWAYYELGWGGFWFWDPVENASLMPWIIGVALIHSFAASEKRGVFPIWSICLALLAFILSLLGTFLIRSGVLTSVHSFAADPKRGVFILALFALFTSFGLILLLFRGFRLSKSEPFSFLSKETFILINNILLAVAFFVVFLGTLYPLIADIFNLGKISVGEPYFNSLMRPLAFILLFFLGIGPLLRFKQDKVSRIFKPLSMMAVASIILALITDYGYSSGFQAYVLITLVLCYWALAAIIVDIYNDKRPNVSFFATLLKTSLAKKGMFIGHLGFVMTMIGFAFTSEFSIEKDIRLAVNESVEINHYKFTMKQLEPLKGRNYEGERALIEVTYKDAFLLNMRPEKRTYTVSGMPLSEVAMRPSLLDDLYVAMGDKLDAQSWAMRIYVKPFVRWIWLGGLVIALGGLVAMIDRRYKIKPKS